MLIVKLTSYAFLSREGGAAEAVTRGGSGTVVCFGLEGTSLPMCTLRRALRSSSRRCRRSILLANSSFLSSRGYKSSSRSQRVGGDVSPLLTGPLEAAPASFFSSTLGTSPLAIGTTNEAPFAFAAAAASTELCFTSDVSSKAAEKAALGERHPVQQRMNLRKRRR